MLTIVTHAEIVQIKMLVLIDQMLLVKNKNYGLKLLSLDQLTCSNAAACCKVNGLNLFNFNQFFLSNAHASFQTAVTYSK